MEELASKKKEKQMHPDNKIDEKLNFTDDKRG